MTITTLTPTPSGQVFPEIPAGAQAAAAAVNKTCELGRPVQIVSCDEHYNPNGAAACARRAVSEDVLATAMMYTAFGDAMVPVLGKAGIPVFDGGTSQSENTAPNSFPMQLPIPELMGAMSGMAATGAKKIAIAYLDTPSVGFFVNLAKQQAEKVGLTLVGNVALPPAATDMTQYAAQILSSGAEAYTLITAGPQVNGIIRSLQQQGADPDKLKLFLGVASNPASVLQRFPGKGEGIYTYGVTWPYDDTTNPGIKKYRAELKDAGQDSAGMSEMGVLTWTSVHTIVNALKGGPVDAATLLAKMQTVKINEPQVVPFDFSANAFPNDPVLKNLRLFSSKITFARFKGGKFVPLTDDFVDVLTVPKLTRTG